MHLICPEVFFQTSHVIHSWLPGDSCVHKSQKKVQKPVLVLSVRFESHLQQLREFFGTVTHTLLQRQLNRLSLPRTAWCTILQTRKTKQQKDDPHRTYSNTQIIRLNDTLTILVSTPHIPGLTLSLTKVSNSCRKSLRGENSVSYAAACWVSS